MDALVLAEAGLDRLGVSVSAVPLPFVTSAGQGAVVAETVSGSPADKILRSLNHAPTWYEVTAERGFLSRLASGCVCPVGVNAIYASGKMEIAAEVYPMEPGGVPERASVSGSVGSERDALALAEELWEAMRGMPVTKDMAGKALRF
jgi:hydroxymethylbilane synthase